MKALLDVVRAQHSATEGSEEKPFDINDIIDMAMNITGRPEEPTEQQELSDTIQKMAESMAPDIFPPKTFEEMDDSERAASAVNMIEERLKNGGRRREEAQKSQPVQPVQVPEAVAQPEPEPVQPQVQTAASSASQPEVEQQTFNNEDYGNGNVYDMFGQDDVNPQEAANLNDLIYNNFMQMMGLNDPKVEYPFDRSQIRYGREKTATEMLAEDEANQAEERALEEQRRRPVSAWELAQAAVDKDEEAHQKEEYEPKEMQMPETKSASQLAAEAIAKAREEDQMKLEAEKRAELLMEEARKRGKDPMEFALHQQEILNYMEKNSDELVSFEDYEDLSPEEKLEIERELYKEKQLEAGVAPEDITDVPDEIKEQVGVLPAQAQNSQAELQQDGTGEAASDAGAQGTEQIPAFSDDMLRMISQEVVQENADMILSEDANADLGVINETIFENLKRMMSQSGGTVSQEDMESLIGEVISRNTSETPSVEESNVLPEEPEVAAVPQETPETGAVSAVELARAAQQAARPEPQEVRETKSAVDIAKEAQEIEALKKALAAQEKEEELSEDDLSFDELDLDDDAEDTVDTVATQPEPQPEALEEVSESEQKPDEELEVKLEAEAEQKAEAETEQKEEKEESKQEAEAGTQGNLVEPIESEEIVSETEQPEETALVEEGPEESDEYEYVDPGELVLGEHTQAEIDEALDNLASLGLEGDVYERAKRMLLLELAGSETVLDAWLEEQENGKKKKATVSALDKEEDTLGDLEDLDEDDLERELEIAMDEDFVEEELEEKNTEENTEDSEEPTVENVENAEETGVQDNTDSEEAEKLKDTESMENAEDSEESAENISAEEAATEEVNTESVNTEPADQEDSETLEDSKDLKESERSVLSDDEDEKEEDKTAQKDADKESETAEYISESEHTIQVEKTRPEKEEKKSARVKKDSRSERSLHSRKHKNVVKRKEKAAPEKEEREFTAVIPTGKTVEEKEFQVSVRNPFVLKNSASFMDKFEEYIVDTQENRKLSTGFKRLDAMLRYGLHKGSYFVDSMPQYLKNGFMQQIADRAAESGVDVLYISTELSRYDLMVDTVSRLSYEMNKKDEEKAVSSMAIMTGEKGADIRSLKDELNWYRGRISEHLFVLDQEAVSEYVENMEDASASDILEELIRSIVTEGAHKPVVFIDNIENILSVEDSEDMKPLMDGIRKLAKELGIPILMSYGYAQAESESELDPDEIAFHESLGNMCDVYLELKYADMITENYEELTEEDIEEMVENGEMLLINVLLHKNRRTMKASCQIQATPKFNYYEE